MDKEWIARQILENRKSEAADLIAQAHEQELQEMEHRYQQGNRMDLDIAGMALIDMKKAQAQVAVMAEALDKLEYVSMLAEIDLYTDNYGLVEMCPVCGAVKDADEHGSDCWLANALQSAPTVLFHGQGPMYPSILTDFVDMGNAKFEIERLGEEPLVPSGQQVEVIVLEGPNALQEQSKAQEPDSECSVNEGCQAKGKQEE